MVLVLSNTIRHNYCRCSQTMTTRSDPHVFRVRHAIKQGKRLTRADKQAGSSDMGVKVPNAFQAQR